MRIQRHLPRPTLSPDNTMPNESDNGGCGCLSLILTILALDALWFGLPTPWGTLNIDIFWPAIHLYP